MLQAFIETLTVSFKFALMDSPTRKLVTAFINTPPLWTRTQFGVEQFVIPEIDLSRIDEIRFPDGMRLGHKMELIFTTSLQGQDTYELIDQNIVISRNKITLGELDFLLRDSNDGSFVHLELTYKFYLIDTEISEPIYQLVGPNRRDMFFTKLDKLKKDQFPMPFSSEGAKALEVRGIKSELLKQKTCFKAQLFTPYIHQHVGIRPLNKSCISGYWIRFDQLNSDEFRISEYYLPSKEEWALKPYDIGIWISHYELLLELNIRMLKQSSAMVWARKEEDQFEKFFVVWW